LALKVGIRVSIALAIIACGLSFVPAMASAATGAISGTVTAASGGAALRGIEVCAYEVVSEEEACIFTSASGEYTISGLAPGSYKVEFWPHAEGLNFNTQYYNDKPSFAMAETVTVIGGVTTPNIDAQLHEGGRIAGTVTDASTHAGIGGIVVCALESIGEAGGCTLTATTGQYVIAGLPSGAYEVVFAPNFEEGPPGPYITQYYNGKPTFATADLVSVTVPATTFNIDAALAKRPTTTVPTISTPPVIAPTTAPAPVAKPKPLTCRKGFRKKTVAGKAKCMKIHRHRRHRQPHRH